jgi:hypothetical protein
MWIDPNEYSELTVMVFTIITMLLLRRKKRPIYQIERIIKISKGDQQ